MEKTFMARKMEKVGPNQKQRFTGCGRNGAGGTPAGARTGGGAGLERARVRGRTRGRRAKAREGEVVR